MHRRIIDQIERPEKKRDPDDVFPDFDGGANALYSIFWGYGTCSSSSISPVRSFVRSQFRWANFPILAPPPPPEEERERGGGRENPINLNQFLLLFLVPFFRSACPLLPPYREKGREFLFLAGEAFSSPVEYAVGAGGIHQYSLFLFMVYSTMFLFRFLLLDADRRRGLLTIGDFQSSEGE